MEDPISLLLLLLSILAADSVSAHSGEYYKCDKYSNKQKMRIIEIIIIIVIDKNVALLHCTPFGSVFAPDSTFQMHHVYMCVFIDNAKSNNRLS